MRYCNYPHVTDDMVDPLEANSLEATKFCMKIITLFMSDVFAEISLHLARHFSLDSFQN